MTEQTKGSAPDWASLRARYELAQETVTDIATSIGITGQALSRKAKALGWALRGATKTKRTTAWEGCNCQELTEGSPPLRSPE